MKKTKILVLLLIFAMLSGVFMLSAQALEFPKLPTQPVTLTVEVDVDTYPLLIELSDVPNGFDVADGVYTGWCFSLLEGIVPNTAINPVTLTYPFTDSDKINYLLNNQDDGTSHDVQAAIWIIQGFTTSQIITSAGGTFTSSYDFSTAENLAEDAEANGVGFVPGPGQILSVLCIPPGNEQDVLIQLCVPGGGKVTGGGQCVIEGVKDTIPAGSFGFNAMWFSRNELPNGEINYVDHVTGDHVHVHQLQFLNVWEPEPGNKPQPQMKAWFWGYDVYTGLRVDVYVEDHGEPGKNDRFLILLDGAYLGGSGNFFQDITTQDVPILAGNIQIHKPPK